MRSSIGKAIGLLLLGGGIGLGLWNTSRPSMAYSNAALPSQLIGNNLIGVWIFVGEPDNVSEAPATGGGLKFFTGKHWCITQANPTSGLTIYHHGGTYTLKGDQYAETVEYANENTKSLIKKTFHFTIKIEGVTLTQTGTDNSWSEVWKRVE